MNAMLVRELTAVGVQGILQCQSANSCGGTGDTAVSEC